MSLRYVMWLTTACLAAAALGPPAAAQKGMGASMQVSSSAFSSGANVPKRNSCDGEDLSPALAWSAPPAGTRSLAIIADDPDAPRGTFTHWLAYNIPAEKRELPAGVPAAATLAEGGAQGRNGFGKLGYGGPCPPPGKPHRYFFRVFALDVTLAVKPGADREELERAMQGHVLAQGELMGRYGR